VNLSSLGLKDPIAKMIARAMRVRRRRRLRGLRLEMALTLRCSPRAQENRNLRSFSLWENDFTSEGMRAIAEALKVRGARAARI
jgi:hypothetical protein